MGSLLVILKRNKQQSINRGSVLYPPFRSKDERNALLFCCWKYVAHRNLQTGAQVVSSFETRISNTK